MTDELSHDDFWDRVGAVNAGMLETTGGQRGVPMTHHSDSETRTLWFITSTDTALVDEVGEGPVNATYTLAEGSKGLYAHLHGSLSLSHDRDKLDDLWSPATDAWFEGGKDDPDVRLLSFSLTNGEAWLTPTGGIAFVLGIARARITGTPPDMGTHLFV